MPDKFWSLNHGDIVQGQDGATYMVAANYGDRITAVRTADLTNPYEWKLVAKAQYIAVPG